MQRKWIKGRENNEKVLHEACDLILSLRHTDFLATESGQHSQSVIHVASNNSCPCILSSHLTSFIAP